MLIQVPSFLHTGFTWSFVFLKWQELKKFIYILLPRMLTVSAQQMALTLDTFLASSMLAGSIVLVNMSANLQSLPYGIFAVSISITAFASMSLKAAENNKKAFLEVLAANYQKTIYWLFPATFGMFIVLKPLIQFLFEYGKFSAGSVLDLLEITKVLLFALFFQGLIPLLSRAYFSWKKTWYVFFATFLGLVLNMFLSIYLAGKIGVLGLAYGTFAGLSLQALILFFSAWKDFGRFFSLKETFLVLLSSFLMYFATTYSMTSLATYSAFLQVLGATVLGGFVYLLLTRILKSFNLLTFSL
jgi:putative peptidoglycan lipid II flippase